MSFSSRSNLSNRKRVCVLTRTPLEPTAGFKRYSMDGFNKIDLIVNIACTIGLLSFLVGDSDGALMNLMGAFRLSRGDRATARHPIPFLLCCHTCIAHICAATQPSRRCDRSAAGHEAAEQGRDAARAAGGGDGFVGRGGKPLRLHHLLPLRLLPLWHAYVRRHAAVRRQGQLSERRPRPASVRFHRPPCLLLSA